MYRKIIIQDENMRFSSKGLQTMATADLVLRRTGKNTFDVVKDRYGNTNKVVTLSDAQQAKILLENEAIGV